MKEPRKVPAKGPSKFDRPGKPTTVTGKPSKFDDLEPAKDPATPEEVKEGFTRLPPRKRKYD
jgi:hypothetical protein